MSKLAKKNRNRAEMHKLKELHKPKKEVEILFIPSQHNYLSKYKIYKESLPKRMPAS
jgi:hypothetical protein